MESRCFFHPMSQTEKNLQCRRLGLDPWVRKIPWRRELLSTPGFLPGECHGQRSLGATVTKSHKHLHFHGIQKVMLINLVENGLVDTAGEG